MKEEELTLKLKIRTSSEEDRNYFFTPEGEVQPGFLVDLYDMLDMVREHILTINGQTHNELWKKVENSKSESGF